MNKNYPPDLAGRMVYSEKRGMGMIICREESSDDLLGWFEELGHAGNLRVGERSIPSNEQHGWFFEVDNHDFLILPRLGEKIWVWDDECKDPESDIFTGFDTTPDTTYPIITKTSKYRYFAFIEPEEEVEEPEYFLVKKISGETKTETRLTEEQREELGI